MMTLALSLLNEIPLALMPMATALPWLMLLTVLAGRWLPSPACGRAALALTYPALALALLGVAEWFVAQPVLTRALLFDRQPEQASLFPWMNFICVGSLWLAGSAFLAVATRRAAAVWTSLLAAGILFAAAAFAVPWLWNKSAMSTVDNAFMAKMFSEAWRTMLRGLGPAAALALVWTLPALPARADEARRAPDEALPLRWFAALAAAVYLWRLASRLLHDWGWFQERFLPLWNLASGLPEAEVFSLGREGMSLALWSASVGCWLLLAFRPGRPGRVWLVLLACAGLACAWLTDWGPVQWATWRGFLSGDLP